jgi:hypothetical protein
MTAWQQLHRHSRERGGTPIPLDLKFPWSTQRFWGSDREYLWFRSTWAPKVIGCGFMALEEWCFAEVARDRPVDELIQQIVAGNECIAILGTAGMLALHTETVSETTFPILTAQRLLAADHNRLRHDLSPTASLIGFTHLTDRPHIEAIKAANARSVRKTQLSWMVPRFVFAAGPICDRARDAIINFKNDLPYQYEEHRNIPEAREHLTAQALEYAEMADPKNYQAFRAKEDSDEVEIVHISPSAAKPEIVARAEEAFGLGLPRPSKRRRWVTPTRSTGPSHLLRRLTPATCSSFRTTRTRKSNWACVEVRSLLLRPSRSTSDKGVLQKTLSGLVMF